MKLTENASNKNPQYTRTDLQNYKHYQKGQLFQIKPKIFFYKLH